MLRDYVSYAPCGGSVRVGVLSPGGETEPVPPPPIVPGLQVTERSSYRGPEGLKLRGKITQHQVPRVSNASQGVAVAAGARPVAPTPPTAIAKLPKPKAGSRPCTRGREVPPKPPLVEEQPPAPKKTLQAYDPVAKRETHLMAASARDYPTYAPKPRTPPQRRRTHSSGVSNPYEVYRHICTPR